MRTHVHVSYCKKPMDVSAVLSTLRAYGFDRQDVALCDGKVSLRRTHLNFGLLGSASCKGR